MPEVWPRVSYADLELLPEDGRRFELYDGELFEMPAPTIRHQRVAVNVIEVIRGHERRAGGLAVISPVDVVLTKYDVVQPDVVYFLPERIASLNMLGPARIPPDLAVEVLSPGTTSNDHGRKMALLARHGVREYWLIDPIENRLERYVLEDRAYALDGIVADGDVVESRVLTDFHCNASTIFAE